MLNDDWENLEQEYKQMVQDQLQKSKQLEKNKDEIDQKTLLSKQTNEVSNPNKIQEKLIENDESTDAVTEEAIMTENAVPLKKKLQEAYDSVM